MGFPRWKFEFQPKISCKPIRISLAHKFLNQTTDFVGLHRNRPCISARSTTLAPPVGLEPTTYRLTADRSTIELWRIIAYSSAIGVKFQLSLHPNFDTIHEIEKMHPQRVQTGAFWRRWLYLGAYGCIGRTRVHDKLPSLYFLVLNIILIHRIQAEACQSSAKRGAAVYKNIVARMIYLWFTSYRQRWRVTGNDIN